MKALLSEVRISLLLTAVFALLLCGAYPAAVWLGGQALFADKANGSLVVDKDGTVRGSRLLAQNFFSDKYFQPRPSAAGTGYDAASSGGTNLGPTSQKLSDSVQAERVAKARGLPPESVRALVAANTEGRDLGLLGEAGVNVLRLNIALDR